MGPKIFAGILSAALLIVFVWPVVWKLKDAALTVVVMIGLAMMLYDLWGTLREKDE